MDRIEVFSVVSFDNPKRVPYLERSFGSFHSQNAQVRHVVVDGSREMGEQKKYYERFGAEVLHRPGVSYAERFREGLSKLQTDYFVFLPDDFTWIFQFPVARAIEECRRARVQELKLTCRGMDWFSTPGSRPEPWVENGRVMSGEQLVRDGDLWISKRRWTRDFHEQFSLACNLIETDFARWIIGRVPRDLKSPGQLEKWAYVRLLLKRYKVGYYKFWIPAFHFIDFEVEGASELNLMRAKRCLIPENVEAYNLAFNR